MAACLGSARARPSAGHAGPDPWRADFVYTAGQFKADVV